MHKNNIPDFLIEERGPMSRACLARNLNNFRDIALHVRALAYGRISNASQIQLVLDEERGTCSSKHAFLAEISRENEQAVKLMMGIYMMNEENTPGVGPVLGSAGLHSIPEAHCYLLAHGIRFDFTRPENSIFPSLEFLTEECILPSQVGGVKVEKHKLFFREWSLSQKFKLEFDELWTLRERCIENLRND